MTAAAQIKVCRTGSPPGGEGALGEFDVINARFLKGFAQLCAGCGGDARALIEQARIAFDPGAAASPQLTYGQFVSLLAQAARTLECPDFGMRLALAQSGTDLYGPLGTIMRHSRTFGDALDYVTRHSNVHSRAARIARFPIPKAGRVVFSHEILVGDFAEQGQAIEYVLLAGQLGALALTQGLVRARQVLLRHRAISPLAVYRRAFGCEVLFDQLLDGLVFSDRDLACPIAGRDPGLHADLMAAAEMGMGDTAPPIHAAARGLVLRLMLVGTASNAQVAAELGLHTRTLHRRLAEAGTSFQKIKDEVRCELARYYLAQADVSLLWIAGKLGFAEQAVFTRFCHRHLGAAPSALQARLSRTGSVPSQREDARLRR
ncbi:AraC family transcriptional regulator ligand-binding domain-containing protein [Novosphingobium sp. 9U]|uniref:AraC family transcriptional regulator n=1 Tax=Novosphingobium sp. 9U TaxID=2653158 RepID=UPI0012F128CE|nr:AraC family transcriptional regulator ligand-binding domain-containing protein [Novosphingobium sp. 9U]VWX48968.1 DNA-binding domain-containing protein, AraC-type [Novosphingobium sp. 9U]